MNSSLVFSFLAMRFCIIFYIISDSFHLMRLKKLYKKYRDKRLHPKIYFLVTFVLFLLMIKDMIFICFNEIYGIISEEIKRINRMMSPYKAIKELEIKKDDFIKTTTMKIKRKEEIEKADVSQIITADKVEQVKQTKTKKKNRIVKVEAKKINDKSDKK